MKITGVRVTDPRSKGKYQDPSVAIFVDQPVYENSMRTYDEIESRMALCGPFFAPEDGKLVAHSATPVWVPADLGLFNRTGYHSEQLIRVMVHTPEEVHDDLCFPVQRLRRLLRRHTGRGFSGWGVVVDQEAALAGNLLWRIELNGPNCFRKPCPHNASEVVVYRGAHLNLCPRHRADLEEEMASTNKTRTR